MNPKFLILANIKKKKDSIAQIIHREKSGAKI